MSTSRRDFLKTGTAALAGISIVPRHVLGGPAHQAPSDTLRLAAVGAGGMGAANLRNLTSEQIVAMADVDWEHASESAERFPDAQRFHDFRVMLDAVTDLDGVVIATPDHTHAVIADRAMRRGLHVYVQKPLTATVEEARYLNRLADETDVITQMGNQGRSMDGGRRVNELLRAGVIGTVQEVHAWTDRPIWPQGVERPEAPEDLPEELAWDVFLGPASYQQYHSAYHPFSWRGWVDFGVGALGDMGAHLVDHAVWALELDRPSRVEASSTPFNGVSYPEASLVRYTFDRDDAPPLDLTWYDGGLLPPLRKHLPADVELVDIGMVMYVGEDGVLLHESYGRNPQVFPADRRDAAEAVPETLPRVEASHEMNWVNAIKGTAEATSPFSVGAPVTETLLLGVVALRAGQPITIAPDGAVTPASARPYLGRSYRGCWNLVDDTEG